MELKINENKLKVKYVLGNYKVIEGYPTSEDIMYFLMQWVIGQDKKTEYIFHDSWLMNELNIDKNLKDDFLSKIDSLVKDNTLSFNKETNIKKYYKIEKNPFE